MSLLKDMRPPYLGANLLNLWQEIVQPIGDAACQLLHVLHAVQDLGVLLVDLGRQLLLGLRKLEVGHVQMIVFHDKFTFQFNTRVHQLRVLQSKCIFTFSMLWK